MKASFTSWQRMEKKTRKTRKISQDEQNKKEIVLYLRGRKKSTESFECIVKTYKLLKALDNLHLIVFFICFAYFHFILLPTSAFFSTLSLLSFFSLLSSAICPSNFTSSFLLFFFLCSFFLYHFTDAEGADGKNFQFFFFRVRFGVTRKTTRTI